MCFRFILIRKTTGYVQCDDGNEPLGFGSASEAADWLVAHKSKPGQWRIARLRSSKA